MWQDHVLAAVQVVFALALLPTLVHPTHKPPISSSVITTSAMAAVTFTYFSLALWWSAALAAIVTLEWFIIGLQRHQLNKKERRGC